MDKPREEIKQIGHGSLHLISSVEEEFRSEGRTLSLDTKLLWFKIAHLDKDKKIIEGKAVTFEFPPYVWLVADFLSSALKDLLERTYMKSIGMGNSDVEVIRLDEGIFIKKGDQSVEIPPEDIVELIDKLGFISAISKVR